MTSTDELVSDYLRSLERESAALPALDREELLDQIRSHIEAARSDPRAAEAAYLREVLEDLGTPAEIVAAARVESGLPAFDAPARNRGTGRERLAVWLLAIGWLLIGIGWLVGLALAWTSNRWDTREKIGATFLAGPMVLALLLAHQVSLGVVEVLFFVVGAALSAWAGRILIARAARS